MTTSILDAEELFRKISGAKGVCTALETGTIGSEKSISGREFVDRIKQLLTPDEAEALARGIEESRAQAYD
jgi:hypothetical protein